ncbi:MAG: cytochrome c3 family protein [Planctomycetota bacterium]|jgi:hypothetical protein|nr:cytochrome c3 family protein [Planctomycetota bacterium]
MSVFEFPRWTDKIRPMMGLTLAVAPVYVIGLLWYGASPETMNTGYSPEQPIPFSHALHAGELGMDCRYCHITVEESATASIPPSSVCMNCHERIHVESIALEPLRQSVETGNPIEWMRVHDLPDYVYFDHSAHVNKGVSCVECHGRVDTMDQVKQVEPMSMGWCLDCHRHPEPQLRPKDLVTKLDWETDENREELGAQLRKAHDINPREDCSACHR